MIMSFSHPLEKNGLRLKKTRRANGRRGELSYLFVEQITLCVLLLNRVGVFESVRWNRCVQFLYNEVVNFSQLGKRLFEHRIIIARKGRHLRLNLVFDSDKVSKAADLNLEELS